MLLRFLASCWSLLILAGILAWVTIAPPYPNEPPIRSDGLGYHFWTHAILRGDSNFAPYYDGTEEAGLYPADPARGFYHNKYAPGVAIVRLPAMIFFADTRTIPVVVSKWEHRLSLILADLALLVTAFLILRCCRLLGLPATSSQIAMLAIVFGTGLFHFATYDGGFSHVYSALGLTVLFFDGVRSLKSPGASLPAIRTFVVVLLLLLIRNTNLVAIGILTLGYGWFLYRDRRLDRQAIVRMLLIVALPAAIGLGIQICLNSHAHGRFTASSYGKESFLWDRPMALSVLVSSNHGLLLYYPVLVVVLIAGLIRKETRGVTCWFALLLAAYVILYGYWHCWWLGGSYGHRGEVELMPFAIPILAACLARAHGAAKIMLLAVIVLSVVVALVFLHGYWEGTLPFEFVTWKDYFDHLTGKYLLVCP